MNSGHDDELGFDLFDIPDPASGSEPRPAPPRSAPIEPSPTVSTVRSWRLGALLAGLAWIGGHLAVFGMRPDLHRLPVSYVALQCIVPVVLALAVLFLGMRAGKSGLGTKLGLVAAAAVAGPLAFVAIGLVVPAPAHAPHDAGMVAGVGCLDVTLIWAAAPLVFAGLALRRAFVTGARWRATAVGAACGLLAGATMNGHCVNSDPVHVGVFHGLAVVLSALVGALLIARWARA